jgi:hypothetical protein
MQKIYHANTNQRKSGASNVAELYSRSLESDWEKGH